MTRRILIALAVPAALHVAWQLWPPRQGAVTHMPVIERAVELRMEDGTWELGTLEALSCEGVRALIEWQGITAWYWREQGSGHVNEWRYAR